MLGYFYNKTMTKELNLENDIMKYLVKLEDPYNLENEIDPILAAKDCKEICEINLFPPKKKLSFKDKYKSLQLAYIELLDNFNDLFQKIEKFVKIEPVFLKEGTSIDKNQKRESYFVL